MVARKHEYRSYARSSTNDQGDSIDTPHDEKGLSTSLVDPMGQKKLLEIKILQNKSKKSVCSPVAPEGIDISCLMD
jgi:hypothetical protein